MKYSRIKSITFTILLLVAVLFLFAACQSQAVDEETLQENLELNFIAKAVEALYGAVGNYGWTMVLVTVILKVAMLPLDFWQKISAKKGALQMKEMAPLIAAIDKKYASDPQKANFEKQKVYKKQGYSLTSSCLPMLVTMIVFIFVFSGVNSYARFRNYEDYTELYAKYEEYYAETNDMKEAQSLVNEYYKAEIQESWLWIKSIWSPDTWEHIMEDFDGFASSIGLNASSANAFVGELKENYNIIYEAVVTDGDDSWNGLLILPLACVALSFLSIYLPQIAAKKNNETPATDPQQATSNKVMMFMMPAMMAYFGFIYTGAFAIYITCNYALSLLSTVVFAKPVEKMAQKSFEKTREKISEPKASYKR